MWAKDRVANLVVRLRHNVIRAGLRRINLAYWRISLTDIASKLGELCFELHPHASCSAAIIAPSDPFQGYLGLPCQIIIMLEHETIHLADVKSHFSCPCR